MPDDRKFGDVIRDRLQAALTPEPTIEPIAYIEPPTRIAIPSLNEMRRSAAEFTPNKTTTANPPDGDKGDITVSGGGLTWTIDPQAVTFAKIQNIASARILGRLTVGVGPIEELTAAQVTAFLNVFTAVLQGLVPASGGGIVNFLRADGTWAAPASGSSTFTAIEQNLGATPTWRGTFTVIDALVTPTSKVHIWQAPGPYTGKGTRADEAEMDYISAIAAPGSGQFDVMWRSVEGYVTTYSDVAGLQTISALNTQHGNPLLASLRQSIRGLVKGNVKFHYAIG